MAMGPVEYFVVAFPGNRFTGGIAPALADLVASGTIRILDLTFITRAEDGTTTRLGLEDLAPEEAAAFDGVEGTVTGLLNQAETEEITRSIPPGSSAALVVWEDAWAVRLTEAVQEAGGIPVVHERIPADVVQRVLSTPWS
ncbi:hypothetical protein GCM10010193_27560 [Kitasatospora atroaurantiaca]